MNYDMALPLQRLGTVSECKRRRSQHISNLVSVVVVVILQLSMVLAFSNSYSISRQQSPTSNTVVTRQAIQQQPQSRIASNTATQRRQRILYAVLQEPDQREKKQSQSPASSVSSSMCGNTTSELQGTKKEDFTLHIGRLLDTLRNEYPRLFTQSPDFTLYDEQMSFCVDLPTIPFTALTYNSVSGLSRYKMVWDMIHGLLSVMYNLDQSYMSSIKLCHDRVRGNVVRVQWHGVLFPRWHNPGHTDTTTTAAAAAGHPPPPSAKCHHIDGVSVYELDWISGKVVQHRVEQLVYTNYAQPIMVMDDVMLQAAKVIGGGIPFRINTDASRPNSCTIETHTDTTKNNIGIVEFRTGTMHNVFRPTSLFAMEAEQPSKIQSTNTDVTPSAINTKHDIATDNVPVIVLPSSTVSPDQVSTLVPTITMDTVAFDAKNKSRKKFGLKPLSVDEFLNIERQVEQLTNTQQKAIHEAKVLAQQQQQADKDAVAGPSLFDKVFGSVMKNLDTCESNFDCVRPQVCCDYVFAKKCCTSGSLVLSNSKSLQYARIPVYGGDNKPLPPR
jgi:Uncharacterized conserved protein (DUF2358)